MIGTHAAKNHANRAALCSTERAPVHLSFCMGPAHPEHIWQMNKGHVYTFWSDDTTMRMRNYL